jgi:SAM-dependent methyltransferase
MPLATEQEIQTSYQGTETAARYVANRFASELHRLLHDRQVATIQHLIDQVRPRNLLEIAPGPGRLTRDLRPSGRLVCLEFNQGMIEHGRAACAGRAAWVRGNGFRLPFAQAFDLAYSFRFVRHFHRTDRDRLYAEIRRVLKPGGYFILDAVNERLSRPLREACPEDYPIYDKLYQPEALRSELAAAGFVVAAMDPVQKRFSWQTRSQVLLGPRANWLNRAVLRMLERLPSRDGLEWIVTCRRV